MQIANAFGNKLDFFSAELSNFYFQGSEIGPLTDFIQSPGLVRGVPALGRVLELDDSVRLFPTQTILCFYVSSNFHY